MRIEFKRDDEWQAALARKFLDPLYRLRGWQVERYPGDHPMQRRHVDVTISRADERYNIDEKIIRGKHNGQRATKANLETWSCSVPGHERRGWIAIEEPSDADILLFAFADDDGLDADAWQRVTWLDCIWVPFAPLRTWFWQCGEERWEEQINKQSNRSISRKVPLSEIERAIPGFKRFPVFPPQQKEQAPADLDYGLAKALDALGRRAALLRQQQQPPPPPPPSGIWYGIVWRWRYFPPLQREEQP